MADRYTQVVILCEDFMHLNFVRRYLIHAGSKRDDFAATSLLRPRSRLAIRNRRTIRSKSKLFAASPFSCRPGGGHRRRYVFGR